MTDSARELFACVVEGRLYEVGEGKPIHFVAGIGLVHDGYIPHTVLGDPVSPDVLKVPNTIDRRKDPS